MAVAVDNTLYFADGANIRIVDNQGIIHTLIGDHHHKKQWKPIPCTGTLKMEEVTMLLIFLLVTGIFRFQYIFSLIIGIFRSITINIFLY